MFWFLIFLAIGIVAGVGLSNARTPEIRLPRTFAVLGVTTGVVLLILLNSTAHPELIIVYAIAVTITEAAWTARTWGRIFPEAGLNFRDIVMDELLHPARIRIAYAHMLAERERRAESSIEHPDENPNPDDDPNPDDPHTPGSAPSQQP
ncbi:hypothetical protein A20C1_10079 [marine actinobacterium PHSC20C1]|nr:hypothetical protein A20C1_10079 [marine actinobacterium PHSC20C1]